MPSLAQREELLSIASLISLSWFDMKLPIFKTVMAFHESQIAGKVVKYQPPLEIFQSLLHLSIRIKADNKFTSKMDLDLNQYIKEHEWKTVVHYVCPN